MGLDAVDSDGTFGGVDSNTNNLILAGTQSITLVAGINNPNAQSLTYKFQIDINNDGNFEDIGSTISNSNEGVSLTYNSRLLTAGTYQTKVLIFDQNGNSTFLTDELVVLNWLIGASDALDAYSTTVGDASDAYATNTIGYNISSNGYMNVNVSNPSGLNLTYRFQIDENNDGVFEDISVLTGNITTGPTRTSIPIVNTTTLNPGSYTTRVLVTDQFGNTQEALDSFTVTPPVWSITGYDANDNFASHPLDGSDISATNTIQLGVSNELRPSVSFSNVNNIDLRGSFYIDSNKDGVFEFINSAVRSGTTMPSNSWSSLFNTSALLPGTYQTKILLTDQLGNYQELYDTFIIINPSWTLQGINAIDTFFSSYTALDENPTNLVPVGSGTYYSSVGVTNTSNANLTYTLQVDRNNDGDFIDAGETYASFTTNTSTGLTAAVNTSFVTNGLAAGNYNVRAVVSDATGLTLEAYDTFTVGASLPTVQTWTLSGLDGVDEDFVFNNPDGNALNIINAGQREINITAGVNNSLGNRLTYTFQIDSNRDGIFETFTTQSSTSKDGLYASYDSSALASGSYDVRVTATDTSGASRQRTDTIFIKAPSLIGFDAVSTTNSFSVSDANSMNIISDASADVKMAVGVNNQAGSMIQYTFRIDSNNDGTFETIEILNSTSQTGEVINYNTKGLAPGIYNAQVIMTDSAGRTSEARDVIQVSAFADGTSVKGFDAADSNSIFDGTDTVSNNKVIYGSSTNFMTVGINNPNNQNLSYGFQIDSNKDGIYETLSTVFSGSQVGASLTYSVVGLTQGLYDTQVIVKDYNNQLLGILKDNIEIVPKSWTLSGFDAVDSDGALGGADSNATNTVAVGTPSVRLTTGVSNVSGERLTYQFFIDSNKDGIYEQISSSVSSTSLTGHYYDYNPSALSAGAYNLKTVVSDGGGTTYELTDVLTVGSATTSTWSLASLNTADSSVSLGTQDITYSANVSNASGNKLTYKFYIDANNDSTYELLSTKSNTSGSGISYAYDISALKAGTYNTKVEVID